MTAAGLGIILSVPAYSGGCKLVPSPLLCIVILTAAAITMASISVLYKELPDTCPSSCGPEVLLNLGDMRSSSHTRRSAVVGLLESMMTAAIADDLTDTSSDRTANARARDRQYCGPDGWHGGLRHD